MFMRETCYYLLFFDYLETLKTSHYKSFLVQIPRLLGLGTEVISFSGITLQKK